MNSGLSGIVPPVVTPLTERGELDKASLAKILAHVVDGGVEGIFIAGSCGEGAMLTSRIREELCEETMRLVGDSLPVMVGVLEPCAEDVVAGIKKLKVFGVNYFVVAPPFYHKAASQDEILRHFRYIIDHVDANIIVYNIPPFTDTDILPQTMVKLAESPRVVAFKDSTSNWILAQQALIAKRKHGFTLFSGNEDLCGAALLFGADGVVPCLANVYPSLYVHLSVAASHHDVVAVQAMQEDIALLRSAFAIPADWIAILKYMCVRKGLIGPALSAHITPLSAEDRQHIDAVMARYEHKEDKPF